MCEEYVKPYNGKRPLSIETEGFQQDKKIPSQGGNEGNEWIRTSLIINYTYQQCYELYMTNMLNLITQKNPHLMDESKLSDVDHYSENNKTPTN